MIQRNLAKESKRKETDENPKLEKARIHRKFECWVLVFEL